MTTIHFVFGGAHTAPLSHICCACGKAPATGVISYAGKVHEPHCEACCKAWEVRMLSERFAFTHYALGMTDFRAWQADRRKA